ncbi:MAG: winged helix-turn-helix domain-containing protein [Acidimicrobiia bacterium]
MPLRSETLRLDEARRIALAAQGLADRRPTGAPDRRHFRRVLDRVGVVQVDSVNVVTRAHELAFLARLGPYDRAALGRWLWPRRGPAEVFEYWGHEASLMPAATQPLLRWRMARGDAWGGMVRIARDRPELVAEVLAAVRARGPVALGELDHLAEHHVRARDSMWGWSDAKKAVEWLFWTGEVAAVRNPVTFERSYLAPEQLLPAPVSAAPTPTEEEAQRELLVRAARSHGVGTARDLADYHRLGAPVARPLLDALVAEGRLRRVQVEGWRQPAYLHPEAALPRRVAAEALLSPFDSLVWARERTERLFGFRYRVEIYVPAAKRVHGYYVLPFLSGEALVARVDLKADRRAGVLRVRSAHGEPGADRDEVVAGLARRLGELAGFLGLDDLAVERSGDLAPSLARAL